jgi:dTDP-4-amino-4,6-dideoxygalactose transaminase
MILFNKPCVIGTEERYIRESIQSNHISGDGIFSKKCQLWFEKTLPCKKALLTPSCTSALEMTALLLDIKEGDEVIMPSYTFVSTANAFVLRGAKIVFVDIRPDTMNIDEKLISKAITHRTKAIVVVHYAGVACEMDTIMDISKEHNIPVVEDSAQGMMSTYKGKALGTIGDFGAFSFHETKNYTSAGEGGLLIVNNDKFIDRAEIIREKGTNRTQFFRGMVDKYSWVDIGSSYLLNDVSASYLFAQLEEAEKINQNRLSSWNRYFDGLSSLRDEGYIELPTIPKEITHNAHMFYIKCKDIDERTALLDYLKNRNIYAVFHYVPLHSSTAGKKFGSFFNQDIYTTAESERLIRLPLYYGISKDDIDYIVKTVKGFFYEKNN